ncbi:hypothetical protein [Breoghania sp.]|uniref:hypothetical protein n=1 Tax=Breoghania sp. TaxID=2065378 RepID=UPI003204D383
MADFVSNFTNRVGAKGRVSVPAPFRAALSREGYEGGTVFRPRICLRWMPGAMRF